MPQYLITAPDGRKFRITGDNPDGAKAALDAHLGGSAQQSPNATSSGDFAASVALPDVNLARAKYESLTGWQKPIQATQDLLDVAGQGLSLGFSDEALAAADTMLRGGTYEENARKRADEMQAARDRSGWAGVAAEIGGGVGAAAKAMKMGLTSQSLPKVGRYTGATIDSAAFGGLTAAGNDQDVMTGAGIGAVLGPAGTFVGDVVSTAAKPVMARFNPERATAEVMEKAMTEAKMTPVDIADDLARARAEGQPSYAVADAMGYPGQRLARNVVRTPGDGRTSMVDFLENRQAGQGRRIASQLAQGFDAPVTAAQKTKALTDARKSAADVNYTAARAAAQDVDVTPALAEIKAILGTPSPKPAGVAPDAIEAALIGVRSRLFAPGNVKPQKGAAPSAPKLVKGFDQVLRIKQELDDAIETAVRSGSGNRARLLTKVRNKLDDALAGASQPYAAARDEFKKASRVIDAVDTGTEASRRGRFEDTIPAFSRMTPEEQAAFRYGYADPMIASTQQAAVGANKARPLINDATSAEFPAFAAPGRGDRLQRQIGREQRMFETRAQALGGSSTDKNLADEADLSLIDPSVLMNLMGGRWGVATQNAIMQTMSALAGQPQSVRDMLSQILRETDPALVRSQLARAVNRMNVSRARKDAIIRTLTLIATSGTVQGMRD